LHQARRICVAPEGVEQQLRSPFFHFPMKWTFVALVWLLHGEISQPMGSMCVPPRNEAKMQTTSQLKEENVR
jgi:hypothetical protein